MYMSVETITIVLSAIGTVVTLGGSTFVGMAWMVRRMDTIAERADTSLNVTRTELKSDIADVRAELTEVKRELKSDILELRTELKGDIADGRKELKSDIADVRTELTEVRRELGDVKVSVARWEGPPRHLAMAR
ncbi:MAG: hypothetical protein JST33_02635 [Actinobacteria bacterium]|nr:hypothetical protein [Actinomycetota bacterium]